MVFIFFYFFFKFLLVLNQCMYSFLISADGQTDSTATWNVKVGVILWEWWAWLFLVLSLVVSMQLPCALGSCLDMSENWAGWVHSEDLVTGTNKHSQGCCNREKSWILKNTFLIRVMEWRTSVPRTGEDRVLVRAALRSQLAYHCAQCLALQTKASKRKHTRKQKAVNLKRKRIKVSSQDGKNVKSQSSHPPS